MVRLPNRLRRRRLSDRWRGDAALRTAIARREVDLVFQPQIDPSSGTVAGVEALARWSRTRDAEALFDRARRAGLEERMNRQLQARAISAAATWGGAARGLALSLNLLPADLARPGYADWLLARCAEARLSPFRLTLELVERGALALDDVALATIARLRAAGVTLMLDDFGTGESGLGRLASLPIDGIKLDRSFIARMARSGRDRVVVAAMLDLARALDLKTVVEGVETTAQLELLATWGCDLYQGFLDAGPLAEAELLRFVTAANTATPVA